MANEIKEVVSKESKENLLKVKEILFDDLQGLPVLVLEDGEKRVPYIHTIGSTWMLSWVTEDRKLDLDAKAERLRR